MQVESIVILAHLSYRFVERASRSNLGHRGIRARPPATPSFVRRGENNSSPLFTKEREREEQFKKKRGERSSV
jgi:hypothetical protein